MLPITDLNGNMEMLVGLKTLNRTRKANGEKTLSFTVLPLISNKHTYPMLDNESIVEFDNEEYVIKKVSEQNSGKKAYKQVTAIHKFFVDLMNSQQRNLLNGSTTFKDALDFIFIGTGYTANIIDSIGSQTLDNFGQDNRLALFQKLLETYDVEFYVVGNQVYLQKEIGSKTDFQYRYNHNVKTIDHQKDTTNLATYIKGFGKQNDDGTYVVTADYTSPNIDIFGPIDAPDVRDDRFTDKDSLITYLKQQIVDEPEVSITIDFIDLRAAGYDSESPNEGDYGFIIYEPMDIDLEARIMEVDEVFDGYLNPVSTSVTLSNFQESITDIMTQFSNTSKQLDRLMKGQEQLPYNVLDDAVKLATQALKSAQTELKFDNGIVAIDKTNSKNLVLFNSAGLGISSDGGETFANAITAYGINTNLLTAGQINANNITIFGGDETNYTTIQGAYLEARGTFTRTWLEETTTYDVKTKLENGYVRFRNDTLDRSLYLSEFGFSTFVDGEGESGGSSGSIIWWDTTYSNADAHGLTINSHAGVVALESDTNRIVLNAYQSVNLESKNAPIYIRPYSEDRPGYNTFDFTLADDDDASRTDGYIMFGSDVNGYASGIRFSKAASDPTVYIVDGNYTRGGDTTLDVGNISTNQIKKRDGSQTVYWNGSGTGTTGGDTANDSNTLRASGIRPRDGDSVLYLATDSGGHVSVTDAFGYNAGGTVNFRPIIAAEFQQGSSLKYKSNIEPFMDDCLDIIKNTDVYTYNLNTDLEAGITDNIQIGFIAEYSPNLTSGDTISLYKPLSINWKGTQELIAKFDQHEDRLTALEQENEQLKAQNQDLVLKAANLEDRLSKLEVA